MSHPDTVISPPAKMQSGLSINEDFNLVAPGAVPKVVLRNPARVSHHAYEGRPQRTRQQSIGVGNGAFDHGCIVGVNGLLFPSTPANCLCKEMLIRCPVRRVGRLEEDTAR